MKTYLGEVVCGAAVCDVGVGAEGTLAGAGTPDFVLYAWITAAVMSVPGAWKRTVGACCWFAAASRTTPKPFCVA